MNAGYQAEIEGEDRLGGNSRSSRQVCVCASYLACVALSASRRYETPASALSDAGDVKEGGAGCFDVRREQGGCVLWG